MTVCMCSSSPSAPWVRLQAVSAAGAVYGVEVLAARHMRVAAFSWQSCLLWHKVPSHCGQAGRPELSVTSSTCKRGHVKPSAA